MPKERIREVVEKLCEALVLAEPGDRRRLRKFASPFEEIGRWAEESGPKEAASCAAAAARLAEEAGRKGGPAAGESLKVLCRAATALQAIVCEGRSPEEVDFPPELVSKDPSSGSEPPSGDGEGVRPPSLFPHIDERIFSDFLSGWRENAEEMEGVILELDKSPGEGPLENLRGIIHTLKGDCAAIGLLDMERVCHATEDLLESAPQVRLTDLLLHVKDWVLQTIEFYSGRGPAPAEVEALLNRLAPPSPDTAQEPVTEVPVCAPDLDVELLESFLSEATEHLDAVEVHLLTLESNPRSEEALNAVFRAFHTVKGAAGFLSLGEIELMSHEMENLLDLIRRGDLTLGKRNMQITFDAVDTLRRLTGNLRSVLSAGKPPERDALLPKMLRRIRACTAKVDGGKRAGAAAGVFEVEPEEDLPAFHVPEAEPSRPGVVRLRETVKVDSARLDTLLDTIGELVIAAAMVSHSPELQGSLSRDLERKMGQLDKITRSLQQMSTSLRMVPVRPVFLKMARLVRDLALKAGKKIEFSMTGEETELDKAVVDRIGDPLVHLLRNAVDHGIEDSLAERRREGKPEMGHIKLRAFHRGGSIYIEVEDDGRGLDRSAILSRGVESGIVGEGETVSDQEVFNLIFEPGFSTAKTVSDVSGRGVGMDVVKKNVESLQGQIEIASTADQGCRFSIRLPLTLAIIDGMIVRVGRERYIIPTLSIVRSVKPRAKDLATVAGRGEMYSLQGQMIPLFRLERLFRIDAAVTDPTQGIVVVVEDQGRQKGLLVDELLGQQQIVIKSVGEYVGGVRGISGGAVMPNGQVGLVIDVGGLNR